MATRGYPKTRFELIDQTQIPTIDTGVVYDNTAIAMVPFTSDKGPENWRMITNLSDFTDTYGGISFERHGQAQITAAEVLRAGGYVFGKRMVSADATLANVTIRARVVVSDGVSYLYTYAQSLANCYYTSSALEAGYDNYNYEDEDATDFPLFTLTAKGRGASSIYFRIVPEYATSRRSSCIRYTFETYDNGELIDSILVSLNPDYTIDAVSQSIQARVTSRSNQVDVKLYQDGVYGLVRCLAKTATLNDQPISIADLINQDFINGLNIRGSTSLGGIVCAAASDDSTDEWTANRPSELEHWYYLSDANGIPLVNGTYGALTDNPMEHPEELTKLLLGVWGKNQDSDQFDPVIYDLDSIKPDAIFDAQYPVAIKNAIIDVADWRGDVMFFCDLNVGLTSVNMICDYASQINRSRYCAMYHNWFSVTNPYTGKAITVTMPFLLASRFVSHVDNGVARPFAGIANNMTFPEIIMGSLNFQPIVIPGVDQKQQLADNCINYINYYDGVPVMETMYVNYEDYTQLSFLHNMLAIQEVIKAVRSNCPRVRYTFLDGDDLEEYLEDANNVLNRYQSNFKSLEMEYMADEKYELNNIFYATITVRFRNFVQEEYFKIYAIN